jgi:general secretion pathway protein K
LRQSDSRHRDGSGFALILVVWILVLIGAIGSYLVANGRAETAIAHNVRAAAGAEALADAGVARVVFNQTDPVFSNRWRLDGEPHRISLPAGEITVRLQDETQKINPNLASDTLLAALFEVSGVDRGRARRLGAAVADWVGPDGPPREGGAKLEQYQAAGRSYGPPNGPLESLDELQLVLGMTPAIMASVRPYLTIYTQEPGPDGKNAPPLIQRAIALAARQPVDDGEAEATPEAKPEAKPQAAHPDDKLIAAEITARSRDGGVFVRTAVLNLEPQGAQPYFVLQWERGSLDQTDDQTGRPDQSGRNRISD